MTAIIADPISNRRFTCCGGNRYIILIVASLFLSMILSSVITFNSTYVSLQNLHTSPLWDAYANCSITEPDWASLDLPIADRRFHWGFTEKSSSFAGAFGGAVVGTQPVGFLIRRFGAHRSMTIIGAIGALAVAFTPFALSWSFPLFVFVRFINGLTFCNLFPVAGMVVNDWAPLAQRGIFVAVTTGHVEIAALYTMPVGAAVASSVGWPYAFWLNGLILAILTFLWAVYYRDRAHSHPFTGAAELQKISAGKDVALIGALPPTPPYRRIFTTPVIWASWIAVIGTFFVSQFCISWAPVYLNNVLGYSTTLTGVISVVPLFFQLFIKIITGLLSDMLTMVDEVLKLRIFNSIALVGAAVFFAVATMVPLTHTALDVFLSVTPIALLGFHAGGYPKCIVMVSRQHSAFVMSFVQMFACGTMLVGSFIVPGLTPHNTFEEWKRVFIFYAAVLVVTNTIFVICARADAAPWTQNTTRTETEIESAQDAVTTEDMNGNVHREQSRH